MKLSRRDKLEIWFKDFLFDPGVPDWVYRRLWPEGNPFVPEFFERKAIFVHVPKAAGSSVGETLFGRQVGHRPIRRHIAYHPGLVSSYFKFTFVRNPWDRVYSAYHYLANHVGERRHRDYRWANEFLSAFPSFEAFVMALDNPRWANRVKRYDHFRSQIDWLIDPVSGQIVMDFIGRYERLEADFAHISGRLDVKGSISHLRASGRGEDYRAAYDVRMVDVVRRLYDRDIQAFGYEFGE